jgi:transposase
VTAKLDLAEERLRAYKRELFGASSESRVVPKAVRTPDLLSTRSINLIGKLFAAEARSVKWNAARRLRLRRRYSGRLLAVIEQLLIEHLPGVVRGSMLGKALKNLNRQWQKPSR